MPDIFSVLRAVFIRSAVDETLPPPRTIDSFNGLRITADTHREILRWRDYWEERVLEEGGPLFLTFDGLPAFDDLEHELAMASANGDTRAWLVLRDKLIERCGERVFALLERAAFRSAIARISSLGIEASWRKWPSL